MVDSIFYIVISTLIFLCQHYYYASPYQNLTLQRFVREEQIIEQDGTN